MTPLNGEKLAVLEQVLQRVLERGPARPGRGASALRSVLPGSTKATAPPAAMATQAVEELSEEVMVASAPPELLQSNLLFSTTATEETLTDETSFAAVSDPPPPPAAMPAELEDGITEVEGPDEALSSSSRLRVAKTSERVPLVDRVDRVDPPEAPPESGAHAAFPSPLVPSFADTNVAATEGLLQDDSAPLSPRFSTDEQPTTPRHQEMLVASQKYSMLSQAPVPSSKKAMPPPPPLRNVDVAPSARALPQQDEEEFVLRREDEGSVLPNNAVESATRSDTEALSEDDLHYEEPTAAPIPVSVRREAASFLPSVDSAATFAPPPVSDAANVTEYGDTFHADVVQRSPSLVPAEAVAVILGAAAKTPLPTTFGELLEEALRLLKIDSGVSSQFFAISCNTSALPIAFSVYFWRRL